MALGLSLVALVFVLPIFSDSEALLKPPCGGEPIPTWPDLDHSPVVKVWDRAKYGADWVPPACTGWSETGFSTLVSTVARFRYSGGADGLLRHIGAISDLTGLRYWSTTHKKWQTLIVAAYALQGAVGDRRRQDLQPGELTEDSRFYYQQEDSLTGRGVYQLRIGASTQDRLVVDTRNVSTLRYFMVPVFHPGDVQSIYFLERESPGVWRYYNIARVGKNANGLAAGHEASSINRAVAFYRFIAGIRSDLEPPFAR
ncbi:MAG: DUF6675 family protein [Terriglobia bacterium]